MQSRKGNSPAAGSDDPRRHLASVAALLEEPAVRQRVAAHSYPLVLDAIHAALDGFRQRLRPGDRAPSLSEILEQIDVQLAAIERDRLRPVVNATGIILHTGLGRAVLPQRAVDALAGLNRCCNLQIDLETGLRGKRNARVEQLLCKLTGAEAAHVVNNNAAATFLILAALCKGREVIISRGQLIEIGGSFRLPDCIHQSGAIMVEVGTTNKTHLRDYRAALNENTGMILRVHPSNYRIVGFTQDVPIADLAGLKKERQVIVVDDLGCGALINLEKFGLPKEPTVSDSIAAGADLACFSGDKMIGGPQAGIIVGRKDLIAQLKKHPLSRMLRVGKMTALVLEQTLRLFLEPESLPQTNPTLRMLTTPLDVLRQKAETLLARLAKEKMALELRAVRSESATGGGSLPDVPIASWAIGVRSPTLSPDEVSRRLRRHEPPIIAYIKENEVLLDMRTLLDGEEEHVYDALMHIGRGP
ncbi:MAG: L-seryl-tRNA(Sec) selenium transferase [Candidatus Sumerlaeia bacterium]|nr:L-seryl-tRNA(Sec) selenium transferase [Candidatus Sumerlaeia bacterium]